MSDSEKKDDDNPFDQFGRVPPATDQFGKIPPATDQFGVIPPKYDEFGRVPGMLSGSIRQLSDEEYQEWKKGEHPKWNVGFCWCCEQIKCEYKHDENVNKPKLCDRFYFLG
jgi:hypothetical protein